MTAMAVSHRGPATGRGTAGERLACSICRKTFSDVSSPFSSCLHTFCPQCLQGNMGATVQGHYECPICCAPVNIPSGSAGGDPMDTDMAPMTTRRTPYSTRPGEATCDICNDGKLATNHCLQCRERFCDSCTNAHLKMKVSRYHGEQVVPLREDGNRILEECCPRHSGQRMLFFCKKCDVLVCNICKIMEHDSHVTKLVSEEANEIREKLTSLLRNQSNYMDNLQSRLRKANDRKCQYPNDLEHEVEKVRQQATKMHLEIEQEKTDSERELEQHYSSYISRVNQSAEHLREEHDQRAALVAEAQQLMHSGNDIRFVHDGSYICQKLRDTSDPGSLRNSHERGRARENFVKTPERPYKRFIPGADPKSHRYVGVVTGDRGHTVHQDVPKYEKQNSQPGRIYTSKSEPLQQTSYTPPDQYDRYTQRSDSWGPSSPLPSEPIRVSNMSHFSLPYKDIIGYIYGIAPISGQQLAWVTILDHNRVLCVNTDGEVQMAVDLEEPCESVSSDSAGGCFVTCPRSKSIFHVGIKGEVSPVVSDLTMVPHGIAAWQYFDTKRREMIEELYVCFTDTKSRGMFDRAKGCVGVFSFFGEDLGRSLGIQTPVRIGVDLATRMLCISDHDNGCVVICDRSGRHTTGIYTGEEDGDDSSNYKPHGVCFDNTSHVIAVDWSSGYVSRISQDGELVQHLITDVAGPQSVAMGDNGILWVGGKKGQISVYRID